jgi:5,6-dimethylbenzimidazole synthase
MAPDLQMHPMVELTPPQGPKSNTAMSSGPVFDTLFRERFRDLLVWRRDVRRFQKASLPDGAIDRILAAAVLAPSVGLSQPARFVMVRDRARRQAVRDGFEACNKAALAAQDTSRRGTYARLKLAGLDEAPVHMAVFADRGTEQGHGLGKLTMPEMIEYSAVTAVFSMWLAARIEGIGIGWVSILDPKDIARILDVPPEWRFIGYFCIGYPSAEDDVPELERVGWETRNEKPFVIIR